jgi:hypothetical protein
MLIGAHGSNSRRHRHGYVAHGEGRCIGLVGSV